MKNTNATWDAARQSSRLSTPLDNGTKNTRPAAHSLFVLTSRREDNQPRQVKRELECGNCQGSHGPNITLIPRYGAPVPQGPTVSSVVQVATWMSLIDDSFLILERKPSVSMPVDLQ